MARGFPLFLALVCLVSLVAVAGCGNKDDAAPTANINGGDQKAEGGAKRPVRDNLHPVVQIRTSLGDILVQLDAENSPVTVNNFLGYAANGHYDGTLFHDVEENFIVLGGGYDANLQEKPTEFPIRNEAHNGVKNTRGTIAMARRPDVIDSSTSHFFFNVADNAILDHQGEDAASYGYCVFGKVLEGMDVVDRIAKTPTTIVGEFERMPAERIAIQSVRRIR